MQRFEPSELTFSRLVAAIQRRIEEIPHGFAWNLGFSYSNSIKFRLKEYNNRYKGQRCFIMANGPSLVKIDLPTLANEITFGLNRIYLLFDSIPFTPNFYVCSNELVLDQFSKDIRALSMPKFLNWNRRRFFNPADESTLFFHLKFGISDGFGFDPTRSLWGGGTVTYVALQLAYYMGFKEVVLVGLDHNFADKGTPNTVETRNQTQDTNHFHPNYFPKGVKWQLPDLRHSEAAYALARKTYEADDRRILDATIGGKCQVFQKVDYNSLF